MSREDELRDMLQQRFQLVSREVQDHDLRASSDLGNKKPWDKTTDDIQEDMESALIEMKRETLWKLHSALIRLSEGTYGICNDCVSIISVERLRALPFALRCRTCDDRYNIEVVRNRMQLHLHTGRK